MAGTLLKGHNNSSPEVKYYPMISNHAYDLGTLASFNLLKEMSLLRLYFLIGLYGLH